MKVHPQSRPYLYVGFTGNVNIATLDTPRIAFVAREDLELDVADDAWHAAEIRAEVPLPEGGVGPGLRLLMGPGTPADPPRGRWYVLVTFGDGPEAPVEVAGSIDVGT